MYFSDEKIENKKLVIFLKSFSYLVGIVLNVNKLSETFMQFILNEK